MRFLSLFLFFNIIYANKNQVYTNQQLTKLVDQLITNQNMIGNQLMTCKSKLKSQESRIQANEGNILENKANISSNSDNLQVLFPLKINIGRK